MDVDNDNQLSLEEIFKCDMSVLTKFLADEEATEDDEDTQHDEL